MLQRPEEELEEARPEPQVPTTLRWLGVPFGALVWFVFWTWRPAEGSHPGLFADEPYSSPDLVFLVFMWGCAFALGAPPQHRLALIMGVLIEVLVLLGCVAGPTRPAAAELAVLLAPPILVVLWCLVRDNVQGSPMHDHYDPSGE